MLDSNYKILEQVGEGGMGVVYSAKDLELQRTVAIKILSHNSLIEPENRERFMREGRLLSQLSHPHVIQFYKFSEVSACGYIVMEFAEGTTLNRILAEQGSYDLTEACTLLRKIAEALDFIHAHNVVHRDLKPANIMVDKCGTPKLIDFGLSRTFASDKLTNTGTLIGTPAYMSPEQCSGKQALPSSDLYSFACIAFECMVGYPPCGEGDPIAIIYKQVNEPPLAVPVTIADRATVAALNSVFSKALNKSPNERYTTANSFVDCLERAILSGVGEVSPATTLRSKGRTQRLLLLMVAATIVITLVYFHSAAIAAVMNLATLTCGRTQPCDNAMKTIEWLKSTGASELCLVLGQDLLSTNSFSSSQRADLYISMIEQRQGDAAFDVTCAVKALKVMSSCASSASTIAQLQRLRQQSLVLPVTAIRLLENWPGSLESSACALELAIPCINESTSAHRSGAAMRLIEAYEQIDRSNDTTLSPESSHLADCIRVLDQLAASNESSLESRLDLLYNRALLYCTYRQETKFLATLEHTTEIASRARADKVRSTRVAELLVSIATLFQLTKSEAKLSFIETAAQYLNSPTLLSTEGGSNAAAQLVLSMIELGQTREGLEWSRRFHRTNSLSDHLKFLLACAEAMNNQATPHLLEQVTEIPRMDLSSCWSKLARMALQHNAEIYRPLARKVSTSLPNNGYMEVMLLEHEVRTRDYTAANKRAAAMIEQFERGERLEPRERYRFGILVSLMECSEKLSLQTRERILALALALSTAKGAIHRSTTERELLLRLHTAAYRLYLCAGKKSQALKYLNSITGSPDATTGVLPGCAAEARCTLIDLAAADCNFGEVQRQAAFLRQDLKEPLIPVLIRTEGQRHLNFAASLVESGAEKRFIDFLKSHPSTGASIAESYMTLCRKPDKASH